MPSLLDRFRATGADLPFGDPLPAHGVPSEGYLWRFTQPEAGRTLTALISVNKGPDGPWSTLVLAAHPNGFLRTAVHPQGVADPKRLGARAGSAFEGRSDRLTVDLGIDARIDVRISESVTWPHKVFGGASFFQSIPAVAQRWHPWLFGGTVTGTATIGTEQWDLTGAQVYAEKRWGGGNFPETWWCGQAQGFDDSGACLAFAGGIFNTGKLRIETTLVALRLPDGSVLRFGGPSTSHVRAKVDDQKWSLHGRNPRSGIEIEGRSPIDDAFVLPVPIAAERKNVPAAIAHLGARLDVVVRRRADIVWRGESQLAALEFGGIEHAKAEIERRGGDVQTVAAPPT